MWAAGWPPKQVSMLGISVAHGQLDQRLRVSVFPMKQHPNVAEVGKQSHQRTNISRRLYRYNSGNSMAQAGTWVVGSHLQTARHRHMSALARDVSVKCGAFKATVEALAMHRSANRCPGHASQRIAQAATAKYGAAFAQRHQARHSPIV